MVETTLPQAFLVHPGGVGIKLLYYGGKRTLDYDNYKRKLQNRYQAHYRSTIVA